MKTKTLLKTFSKAMLGLVLLSGMEAKAQSTVTFSKPGHAMYYEHDRTNWNHIYNITSTYNADGFLNTSVKTAPVTGTNVFKEEYILDAANRLNTFNYYAWQNNAWALTSKSNYIRTLNASGKVTENIYQIWNNGALVNHRKSNNVYDAAGNLIETTETRWANNSWENNNRSTFTYVNGVLTERLLEEYIKNNASWLPAYKYIFAGWHTPGGQHTSYVMQNYDATTGWTNSTRSTITMGQNGSYEELLETYQNGNWQFNTRVNNTYDTHGNKTDLLSEDFVNGTWRMAWTDKYLYTYSAQNDLLEKVYQGQDSMYGPTRNQFKEVYSNFQYFTRALGTSKDQKASLNLTIYPNQAHDVLHIELAENTRKLHKATISDLIGKAVLTQTFEAGNRQQLHVENLRPGIYLLNLETDKGAIVKKFVKQ